MDRGRGSIRQQHKAKKPHQLPTLGHNSVFRGSNGKGAALQAARSHDMRTGMLHDPSISQGQLSDKDRSTRTLHA
ncbi:hypothetical protein MACH17_15300 [Phaeobacter inhibens]|nr:hypothetical protein MACH17_15300 [Phaeobacter inhibens]